MLFLGKLRDPFGTQKPSDFKIYKARLAGLSAPIVVHTLLKSLTLKYTLCPMIRQLVYLVISGLTVSVSAIKVKPDYVGSTDSDADLPGDWPVPADWPSPVDYPPDNRGTPNSVVADWCDWHQKNFCFVAATKGVIADFNIYTDDKCTQLFDNVQLTADYLADRYCDGVYMCYTIPNLPTTFYMEAGGGFDTGAEGGAVYATQGTDCLSGIGTWTTKMTQFSRCKRVDAIDKHVRLKFFPCGADGDNPGLTYKKFGGDGNDRRLTPRRLEHENRRDDRAVRRARDGLRTRAIPHCTGFRKDDFSKWNWEAWTDTLRLEDVEVCSTVNKDGCTAHIEKGRSISLEVSVTTTVSAGIEGLGGIEESLGVAVTREATTAKTYDITFPPGSSGFIGASAKAIEIPGWFTDCGNGWEYRGAVRFARPGSLRIFPVIV